MSKILLSGYYGFANAGDEAMLTAIITGLRREVPSVEITVLSGNPAMTAEKYKVKSIHRFDVFGFLKALKNTDLLLSGGGSLLQDVTSSRSLFYYLSIILMGKLMGKKVMLFAQGIGPIKSSLARSLTKWVCNTSNLMTVRDDGSFEELKTMGVYREKIIVTADAVFSLPKADKEQGKTILAVKGMNKKMLIGLALRHWQGEERYVKEFAIAAEYLRSTYNAQIVFMPLQFPADTKVAENVIKAMKSKEDIFVLEKGFTTEEYLAVVSNLTMVIGMRLHALVFAALENIPFIAISYDPKIDRFVAGMEGTVTATIDKVKAQDIIKETEQLLNKKQSRQQEKINQLREEAGRNILRAVSLLPKDK